jgi:hypothetical protein
MRRISDFRNPDPDAVEKNTFRLVSGLPIQIYRCKNGGQDNRRRIQILTGANIIRIIKVGFPATCAARAIQERSN